MKNTINKIIFFAAVFFAAGLSNISANAAGAISGGFSNGSTNFIIGVAVGYAENGTDSTDSDIGATFDASTACINYPANSCTIITNFANEYLAMYVDLSDIANIETRSGRGMNAADAQAAARENCADSTKCDCVVLARDITENAIQMTVAYSFTAADAENTTVCDTIIEPDVCDGTTATVNEARTACECATDELPILETGGLSCRAIESAADCPGEFFNNAVSPARCDPLPNCDTATTRLNPDTNMCEPTTPPTCEEHETINSSNMCVDRAAMDCGDGEVFSPVNSGGICQTPATFFAANTITVAARYSAESCERAGWISSITINSEKTEVAEVCGIPVERNDNLPVAAARESQPQIADGEMANGCIIRESADFLTLPDCNDSQLFGDDGFPQMPENFNIATDRLIIAVVADGRNRIFFNDNEIRIAVASPRNNDAEVAIIGAVGVAMAMYAFADFLHDGRPADAFAFSSDFGYRISENDYFVRAGGKIEYAVNENLRMQWSAGQTNSGGDFGDFRYLSKAEYKTDLFAAEFSESVAGKTADYDFSLSADLQNGIWKISPVYRMQSEWKESDSGIKTETQNELNLESVLRYNRWTIRPSAGFRWENFGNFTENGKLQMNAVYRF